MPHEGLPSSRQDWMWLVVFMMIGLGLRVTHLDLKTAWMDEVSTVIFSLGNSSHFLPTEQLVDLSALLAPIRWEASATPIDSVRYLLQENNHPPLYFTLAHVWMDLFGTAGSIPSLGIARLFSALLGSLAIPAIFWVAKTTFQSSLAGLISAALMAVSPFSLFLSQEARHYGLAIVLICVSLGCFVSATRSVLAYQSPGWKVGLGWIAINAIAFSNHYFSALTFAGEGLTLAAIAVHQVRQHGKGVLGQPYWRWIYGVAVGTTFSVLLWLPILLNFYGSPQTTFLRESDFWTRWLNPLAQTMAVFMTSFVTPANFFATTPWQILIIASTIGLTLLFLAKLFPTLCRGGKYLYKQPAGRVGLTIMGTFGLMMLGIFAVICYGYGSDITRGLRYMFTYYPAILVLAGGILALYWPGRSPYGKLSVAIPFSRRRLSGRRFVQITWLVGLISSLLIVNNLAFPKYYAPDRLIPFIQAHSSYPIVLGSTEKIFEEPTVIGAKFLSIGWEIEHRFPLDEPQSGWQTAPQFFAIRKGYGIETPEAESFAAIVQQLSGLHDVWMIRSEIDKNDPLIKGMPEACRLSPNQPQGNKGGYLYIHFECRP
jgi:uncharacterized membrane protein